MSMSCNILYCGSTTNDGRGHKVNYTAGDTHIIYEMVYYEFRIDLEVRDTVNQKVHIKYCKKAKRGERIEYKTIFK